MKNTARSVSCSDTLNFDLAQQKGRRRFIKLSAAAMGLAAMPGSIAFAANKLTTPAAVGLQLYTLRDMMTVSLPATLKLVAAVGYKELEFAGYFGHKASEVNTILRNEGLTFWAYWPW